MNIVVLLRAVRDPRSFSVNRKAQKIFINRETFMINPSDRNALEVALRLRGETGRVTAIAAGLDVAEDALRQALAAGADRAILIADHHLQHADGAVVARAFMRLLDHIGSHGGPAELVLLGAEALDADLAQVGPRLAAGLSWPFAGDCLAIEPTDKQDGIQVVVKQAGDFRRLAADLPAVLSVARDSNRPRYATAASVINAYSGDANLERLDCAALSFTDEDLSPTIEARGHTFPPEREYGRRFDGTAAELAAQLKRMAASQ
jgi:electron transfer flavoprotein beta subunit